jgi:hypothetical protein
MSKIVLDEEKLRTELGIVVFDRLNLNHASTSYTIAAGAEATIDAITGKVGFCTIMFDGNGDGVFRMRVYVDGVLDDDFPTNETRIGHYINSLDVAWMSKGSNKAPSRDRRGGSSIKYRASSSLKKPLTGWWHSPCF